ncbi:MAG: DUF1611 domain-containing protein [Acidobacteria bacterium]|nr:DUF1611 domain-containing protein [Acidobacteriota bacterium]
MYRIDKPDGVAVIYCEGCYGNTYGKTAHGLVRSTSRYDVAAVLDSSWLCQDAGQVLDGTPRGIPLVGDLSAGLEATELTGKRATHLVIGMAPDGGQLDDRARSTVLEAIDSGLNVDCGLHTFLNEDVEISEAAFDAGVRLRDVRMPPPRKKLHFFSGKIDEVGATVVALLGTDSAVGKRTTAVLLAEALLAAGISTSVVGTGQTAWLQGFRHTIVLDSLVNDFVAGELEHAVWNAWQDGNPDIILVEGQGSLMHPAYPGGFEILAATRPTATILQHAPARLEYDGFPGHPIPAVSRHVAAIELIAPTRVVAVTLNAESLDTTQATEASARLATETGLPVVNPLGDEIHRLVEVLADLHPKR